MPGEDSVLQFGVASIKTRTGLDDYDLAFVPLWDEDYEIVEELLEDLAVCVVEDFPGLLVGPTGAGKSTGVLALGAILNQPIRRVNMHGDMRSADFVGTKVLMVEPGSGQAVTGYRDGVLPDAMRRGHWILIDEWDACPPEIAFVMQAVLEPSRTIVLTDNYGEVITADPRFRIFATANTLGRGDDSGFFGGTHVQNEATLDRFCVIGVDYPDRDREIEIVARKGKVVRWIAEGMVDTAIQVRAGRGKTECSCTLSTRRLISWARLTARYTGAATSDNAARAAIARAFRMAVGGKLGPEDGKYLAGVIQRTLTVAL